MIRVQMQSNNPHKYDWFYELRPQLISIIGFIGLLNQVGASSHPGLNYLSHLCGVILLAIAYRITQWRREYRRALI